MISHLILFPLLFLSLSTASGPLQSPERIEEGIGLALNGQYGEAFELFDRIIDQWPQHPAGYFFKSATLQYKMMDLEDYRWERDFYALLDTTEDLCQRILRINGEDTWAEFFLGGALGYRGAYQVKKGRWWSGFKNGRRAKVRLEKALRLNPQLWDAYLGLGTYRYWRSRMTRFLRWFPFISDEREKGIRELWLAAQRGIFSSATAKDGLVWIYIEEEEYGKALSLSQELCGLYPSGRGFLWGMARALWGKGDWKWAEDVYRRILNSVEAQEFDNHYNAVECRYWIARCLFNRMKYPNCIRECQTIFRYELDPSVRRRLKEILEETAQLLSRAQRMLVPKR